MSCSVVVAKHIKPPKDLEMLFDHPALVGTERREDYDKLLSAIATAVKPTDAILWILAKDFVDLTWDIQRDRIIKVNVIKSKQSKAKYSMAMLRADYERQKIDAKNPSAFKKKELKPEEKQEDPAAFLVEAYMLGDEDIDVIDRRIASSEMRRSACLREIARYGEYLARKLEKASSEVIDGEFTEATE
jgi:hypothetical protein